ncbi:MAG: FHA domain-containing protein [Candidatus Riflebacteria bacterium]|nr:FHA domain-containing protein [Candidatus Riflebacteria bacterium]
MQTLYVHAFLVVRGKRRRLTEPLYFIGRDRRECEFSFDDPDLSKIHAALVRGDGTYILLDYKSISGVFLNGTSARRVVLKSGDVIGVGNQELQFLLVPVQTQKLRRNIRRSARDLPPSLR